MSDRNNKAVMGLPIYLLIAVVVTAIILGIFVFSTQYIIRDSQEQETKAKIGMIIDEAENMFEHADEGTLVTLHIEFPASLRFIIFGALPKNNIDIPQNLSLDENTSNNYYFVMDNGRISTGHSNARFSSKNTSNIAIFHAGVYDLSMELIHYNGRTYVAIYQQ